MPVRSREESTNAPRLIATFRPQAWVNDYAIDIDGRVEFDATEKFLSLPLDTIRDFAENNFDSDRLAEDLPEYADHHGPFEVDADIDGWLESLGYEGGRKSLTENDLVELRKLFGLTTEGSKPNATN